MGIETGLMAGASLVGGMMGADAAKSAANTQAGAADRATALQKQMYDEGVARMQPFYQTSVDANNKLRSLMGLDGSDPTGALAMTPGYQFRLQQGTDSVQNGAAARGGLLSGAAQKALLKYGQDYASNEYGNEFNRLSSTAGGGQTAGVMNSSGANYGANAGNTMMQSGNALASGQVGAANAMSQGIGNAINGWQQNQLMQLIGGKKLTG